MAGDEGPFEEWEVAFEDVEVRSADSAGEYAEDEMAVGEDGDGDFFEKKGGGGGGLLVVQDGGFHGVLRG